MSDRYKENSWTSCCVKSNLTRCTHYVSLSVGPAVMSHTVWADVPNGWPGGKEHQETIKFGGWGASRGSANLVYTEIKAEKWETAVYILLFSVSIHMQEKEVKELWKVQLFSEHVKHETELHLAWWFKMHCRVAHAKCKYAWRQDWKLPGWQSLWVTTDSEK